MPTVTFNNTPVIIEGDTSILEGLESANFTIPFSCRSGICHSCMMQSDDTIPEGAQKGLSAAQIAQGHFLACSCHPTNDMSVKLLDETSLADGLVVDKKMLNDSVLALFIKADISWFPGQYLNIYDRLLNSRPYSIASRCDKQKIIELHIQRHEHGLVSRWLHDDLKINDTIKLSMPTGNCFYTNSHHNHPLLMVCTGTGLAPIYGVLQEALQQTHNSPIYIYTASGEPSGLYYQQELKQLEQQHEQLHFIPTVRRQVKADILERDVVDLVKERHKDLKGFKVFICGAPNMVKQMQRTCFFQGASISDILVDAFETAKKDTN